MTVSGYSIRRRFRDSRLQKWSMFALGALVASGVFGILTLVHHAQVPLAPEASNVTIPWLPKGVTRWDNLIEEMAKKYNIDPNALAIIMTLESGGYTKADSGQAQGLMQLTPGTAHDIATKYLQKPITKYDLWNPRTNVEFGAAYLAYLRDYFGDINQGPSWNVSMELIAAGYNGGPGAAYNLQTGKGLTDTQTVIYSRDAYNMWRERHASKSPTYDRWLERGGSTLVDAANAEK